MTFCWGFCEVGLVGVRENDLALVLLLELAPFRSLREAPGNSSDLNQLSAFQQYRLWDQTLESKSARSKRLFSAENSGLPWFRWLDLCCLDVVLWKRKLHHSVAKVVDRGSLPIEAAGQTSCKAWDHFSRLIVRILESVAEIYRTCLREYDTMLGSAMICISARKCASLMRVFSFWYIILKERVSS